MPSVIQANGGGDGRVNSIGIQGRVGGRNAPTVYNAAFQRLLFWDGRVASLEDQAKGPLVNQKEMGMSSLESVVRKLRGIPEYEPLFKNAFPEKPSITIDNLVKAIASYERTLITPNSSYDRFVQGDEQALSEQQIRGMALFEEFGCVECHSGANFSGASLLEDAAPMRLFPAVANTDYELYFGLSEDLGAAVNSTAKRGVWRIPSLRNVSLTAPYFHNGSVESLEQAVKVMARVQLNRKVQDPLELRHAIRWKSETKQLSIRTVPAITDQEVADIVAFLKSLEGVFSVQ